MFPDSKEEALGYKRPKVKMDLQDTIFEAARCFDLKKLSVLINLTKESSYRFPKLVREKRERGEYSLLAHLLRADNAFLHFETTGEIQKELYPFFDQKGSWYGMGFEMDNPIIKAKIPPTKFIKYDQRGRAHLLSSLVVNNSDPLITDFASIAGDLCAERAVEITAPKLTEVYANVLVRNAKRLEAPRLKNILGNLDAEKSQEILLPALELTQGHFNAEDAKTLELSHLQEIGGGLRLNSFPNPLQLPLLKRLGDDTFILSSPKITAPKLSQIKGDFWSPKATKLEFTALLSIAGSLYANKAEDFNAPKLISVGGTLFIPHLKSLSDKQLRSFRMTNSKSFAACLELELQRRKTLSEISDKAQGEPLEL